MNFNQLVKTKNDYNKKVIEPKDLQKNTVKKIENVIFKQSIKDWVKWFNDDNLMLIVIDVNEKIITCNNAFRKYKKKPKNSIKGESLGNILLNEHQNVNFPGINLDKYSKDIKSKIGG